MGNSILDKKYMVKITKSLKSSPHLVDEVLYARRQLPYLVKEKYMSYFDTLHAMAKMMYPDRRVQLLVLEDKMPTKEEYIAEHSKNVLRQRKGALTKARKEKAAQLPNLFGFTDDKIDERIRKCEEDIAKLERGEVIFWVMPDTVDTIVKRLKNAPYDKLRSLVREYRDLDTGW